MLAKQNSNGTREWRTRRGVFLDRVVRDGPSVEVECSDHDLSEQRGISHTRVFQAQGTVGTKALGGNSWELGDANDTAQWLTEKDSLRWLVCVKPWTHMNHQDF